MRTAMGAGLLLGLAWLAATPQGVSAQGLAPEVRAVEFVGNTTFPGDSLTRAIATRQTECRSNILRYLPPLCPVFDWPQRRSVLRERDVTLDVQRLERWYQMRGFREVDVEAEAVIESEGQVTVRFSIEEGRPILADSIGYVSPDAFPIASLLDQLPIDSGDRWSTLALDATRDTLVRRLRNRGYPYADVLRQTVLPLGEPYLAHVTFEIEPGAAARYGDIRIMGLENLDESTVLQTLPFRSGDPYRVDQLFDGQARLFGLDIVRNARVDPDTAVMREQSVPDSIVPLFVQVSEGDPYRIRAGVGFNSTECFNAESRWTSRNFFGGGRVLQPRVRLANILAPCARSGGGEFADLTWIAAVDFAQPWIFSTRNAFNASLFAERQSVPEIFIRRAVGLQLALVRAVGPRTPLTLSYRPELSTLDAADVLLCTGFLVCSEQDIDILTGARRLAPVGLNLTRDLANSLLNPTAGYRLIVDLEHAAPWTGSEFRYDRAVVEATWYSRLSESSVLATRLRGGWVGAGDFALEGSGPSNIVHPQKRFYAGGANSVRGFGQSRLGPRVLSVDNPALLLSDVDQILGAACMPDDIIDLSCDANQLNGIFLPRPIGGTRVLEGNVEIRFALGREVEVVTFGDFGQVWGADQPFAPADLEFTPGFGVRYLSPVGPIRVDLGYSFRGSELLSVVTRQIAPFSGDCTEPGTNCLLVPITADVPAVIPYVETGELAVLNPEVLFGLNESRFQLHLSIGQAF